MKKIYSYTLLILLLIILSPVIYAQSSRGIVNPYPGNPVFLKSSPNVNNNRALGDIVNFNQSMILGSDYLKHMQSDITEDNAGNGNPDVDLEDGGWDWSLISPTAPFSHSSGVSPNNLYGVCAEGLYFTYLDNPITSYFTAMQDVANFALSDTGVRDASVIEFLILFDGLSGVPGTTYQDAAKSKFDARITAAGSATQFAVNLRDTRGITQGYPNGIIPWDLGKYVVIAQLLDGLYPGNGYDVMADNIAEVLWQDSFNNNPGLFDIDDDAGWDPTYTNVNYYWYTLGVSGLIDAFRSSNSHTAEIPGLVARLQASRYSNTGAFSFSYGAHPNDEDWQSTAYNVRTLYDLNPVTYANEINGGAYYLAATQHLSGGWLYSDNSHYPEVAGENVTAIYFGNSPSEVWVDNDFTSSSSGSYIWGYNAFSTIQDGITAISGSTINVYPGTYNQDEANGFDPVTGGLGASNFNIFVNRSITIQGVDAAGSPITNAGNVQAFIIPKRNTPSGNLSTFFIQADNVTINGLDVTAFDDPDYNFKTISIIGENATIKNCSLHARDQVSSVYIYDPRYNSGTNTSYIQSYRFEGNSLDAEGIGASGIRFSSGPGWTGSAANRVITGNTITAGSYGIEFVGPGADPWDVYPVGAATITNNSFSGQDKGSLVAWGEYQSAVGYGSIDWNGILTNNTFDKAVIVKTNGGEVRYYDFLPQFKYIRGIYSAVQRYPINRVAQNTDIINVYPGTYNQDEANGFDPVTGGAGGSNFNIFVNKSVTIQGVDATGTPITNAGSVQAFIIPKRNTPSGNLSTFFIQADNVTISGLDVTAFDDPDYNFKTISVIGENATIKNCTLHARNQVSSIYVYDPRYNSGTNTSYIQSYRFEGNSLDAGGIDASGIRFSSGPGWTGSTANRVITGNTITAGSYGVEFVGPGADPWDVYPVGAATITNNSFSGQDKGSVVAWGEYQSAVGYGSIDWNGIFTSNAFDKAVIVKTTGGDVRYYDFLPQFKYIRGIYSAIQRYPINRVAQNTDIINVAAGVYEEQLTIDNKDITIQGAGINATFINSPEILNTTFTTGSGPKKCIVGVINNGNLSIKVLTINGLGRGNANNQFVGIGFRNSGGIVHVAKIIDIKDTPFSGVQHGVAIYCYNDDAISRNFTVANMEIVGFQKNAMALNASDTNPLVVYVGNNIITGYGSTGITAQNGIQVWGDMITGNIQNNTITGIGYSGTGWVATSILNFYSDVNIISNTITDGHVGIYNIDGVANILSNNITTKKIGGFGYGIVASDPPEAIPSPFDPPEHTKSLSKNKINEIDAITTVLVDGNIINFSGLDNTFTYGIEADAGYGPNNLSITGINNSISGFGVGVGIYQCTSGCNVGIFSYINFHNNNILNNTMGFETNLTSPVLAEYNWWGNASGPFHAMLNPTGTGNPVSDNVDFDPWIGKIEPAAPINLSAIADTFFVTLNWNDISNNETGFKIERKDGDSLSVNPWVLRGSVLTGVTTFKDTLLIPNTTYTYRVYAYNSFGNSGYSNIVQTTTIPTPPLTFQLFTLVENSWNMVSIPGLHPVNQNTNTWWINKDPFASVFKFNGSYEAVTTVEPGKGYWMKHLGVQIYNTGEEWPAGGILFVPYNPINASTGWNLIGGYDYIVPTSGITTTPSGLINGFIYGYSSVDGYQPTDNLIPGYGYWINLNGTGNINLPSPTFKGSLKIADYINKEWGKITITDNESKTYILYAVNGEANLQMFDLPPVPPSGIFDIRFNTGRFAENLNEKPQQIDFNGIEYPIKIKAENIDIRITDETGKIVNQRIKSGEEISISNKINKLFASKDMIPDKYSLEQNYPNPFNPTTNITFSLPETGRVRLEIFNILGENVATLIDREIAAGFHTVVFDAGSLPSGTYLYRIQSSNFSQIKKMLLIK